MPVRTKSHQNKLSWK